MPNLQPTPGPANGPIARFAGRAPRLAALAASVLAGCRADGRPDIDRVYAAASVMTLDTATAPVVAVAVGQGRIVSLGTADSLARWQGAGVEVVAFDGGVIAPALTDHHVHLFNVGLALLNAERGGRLLLDLSTATSLDSIEGWVRQRATELAPGSWILGAGWSQAAWGTQELPTNEVLTAAAPNHPVLLTRTDGHAAWVNAEALRLAGIGPQTPAGPGGRIERWPNGRPTGVLVERAVEPVTRLVPSLADSLIIAAYRLAADALAARGVVEVYDAGALAFPGVVDLNLDFGRYLQQLVRADSTEPLPIRVNLMVPAPSRLADSLLADSSASLRWSPRLRITHLKLFADGALGSRGAALTHRYADDAATAGVPRLTTAEIAALARRGLSRGLGIATHAIGDLAVARTLDAYQQILQERPALDRNRLRIEHFSYARDEDFSRAVKLGIVLSVQSNFNAGPDEQPTFGDLRVGRENEPRVYAWDRLERLGAKLAEGSDYFTTPSGPLAGIVATLTRRNAVGERRPDPAGRLLAWRLNAVRYPPNGPPTDPTLRTGSPADLVILSADPLAGPRAALDSLTVRATVGQGSLIHDARPHP